MSVSKPDFDTLDYASGVSRDHSRITLPPEDRVGLAAFGSVGIAVALACVLAFHSFTVAALGSKLGIAIFFAAIARFFARTVAACGQPGVVRKGERSLLFTATAAALLLQVNAYESFSCPHGSVWGTQSFGIAKGSTALVGTHIGT
jgi:hypothetical protein